MTTGGRVEIGVTADGGQATAELVRLRGKVGETKQGLLEAQTATKGAAAAWRAAGKDAKLTATELGQLRAELVAARAAETAFADAAQDATRKLAGFKAGTQTVTNSVGQMRAATTNLGQQVGDIAQGFAMGTSPMTIFAQQGGQVAFAMSGLGGALGKVGTFLSGPWGAALLGATIVLGSVGKGLLDAADAADTKAEALEKSKTASERLADATKELNRITGIEIQTVEQAARLQLSKADAAVQEEIKTRKLIKAKLELIEAERDVLALGSPDVGGSAIALGGNARRGASLTTQLAAQDAAIASAEGQRGQIRLEVEAFEIGRRVAAALDPAVKATQVFKDETARLNAAFKEGKLGADQLAAGLTKAQQALDGSKAAARGASGEKKTLAREVREAAKAYDTLAAAADKGRLAITSGGGGIGVGAALANQQAADAAASQSRENSGLADAVRDAESRLPKLGDEFGARAGNAFGDRARTEAVAIGQLIGGQLGGVVRTIAGVVQGAQTGNFTGVGGQAGGLLTLLAGGGGSSGGGAFQEGFREVFTKPLKSIGDTLSQAFPKNSDFAKTVGKAAGGAATGSAIAGIGSALGLNTSGTGGAIGGAIGGALLGPVGSLLGGLAGSIFGGLFAKSGSTTVRSSGDGNISQSGSGNASVQRATSGLGTTISDTIQSIADALGADVGSFAVSIGKFRDNFRVDRTGTGKIRGSTVTGTKDEREALSLAVADAIRDGAIKTSPRVQSALNKYADNVNKAVAEALKVKGLEDLLEDRVNPFNSLFKNLELTLKDRLRVAKDFGFDVLEIEKINAEEREKLLTDTLGRTTRSVKDLLADLTIGSRATGSIGERIAGLVTERDRASGLARGGDLSQLDVIAQLSGQIDDLQREAFGATAPSATGRDETVALLNDLVASTEARIREAADAAKPAVEETNALLREGNFTLEDLLNGVALTNEQLAQLVAQGGFSPFFSGFDVGQYLR